MAAFVVAPELPETHLEAGAQLNIFPGATTPAVFSAGAPFWVGCGFVPATGPRDEDDGLLDESTRFELEVDGEPVSLDTELTRDGERTVAKQVVATFEDGLEHGWHRFSGRWYVAGRLVLTNETSIEFVER